MATIHSEHLTTAERKMIEERYAPYHRFEEFWSGYRAYQNETGRYRCPHGWSHSLASRAWHQGAEAGMYVRWERKMPARDEYERDDRESALQIATMRRLNKERRRGREKIVGLIHARSQQMAARQPRLIVDNTR
jgi:hypothetical protein